MGKFKYKSWVACTLLLLSFSAEAGALTYLDGTAELSYVNYDVKNDGKKIYSGDSFAQKYAIAWGATNLRRYSQPQYYRVLLGYDWTSFNTNIDEVGVSTKLSETYGKFRYNGEIGYQPINLPVRFKAYMSDDMSPSFKRDIYQGIINDGFYYEIQNRAKGVSSGFSFVFEPERSYSMALRGLPRLHIDYREYANKSDNGLNNIDNKTRELAVAGLNKENNWLHYRSINYENYLNKNDNFEQQQIQIGLIDYIGRRKWSPLTNWITVSADGQLTIRQNETHIDDTEEYDLNFQAIATRKLWEAKTFMNYNRELKQDTLTEEARVPLYVKGIWGRETDWNVSFVEKRGREKVGNGPVATSYLNSINLGMTTFNRSSFTLSPSLALKTEKMYGTSDAYQLNADVTTTSTRMFSDVYHLTAGYGLDVRDDGSGSANSSSWRQKLSAKGRYRATNDFAMEAGAQIESGNGSQYVDNARLDTGNRNHLNSRDYIRSITTFSAAWSKSAFLRTSVNVNYDVLKVQGAPLNTDFTINHGLTYEKRDMTFRLDTRYQHRETGTYAFVDAFSNSGSVEYRPNRYNDASLRYSYRDQRDELGDATTIDVFQRYNHYFYAKTGVLRNIATITEEYSRTYSSQSGNKVNPGRASLDSQYLLLSGRYSPTSRLSLYGSAKYQLDSSTTTMVYSAGLSADFKLLTTNVDYTMATRDSDKRVEKRLSASVRRSF